MMLRAWTTRAAVLAPRPVLGLRRHRGRAPAAPVPHPPIWVAAAGESSVRRAAADGHRPRSSTSTRPVDQIAERIRWFDDGRGRAIAVPGRSTSPTTGGGRRGAGPPAAAHPPHRRGGRAPSPTVGSYVLGYADTEEHALVGTPDEVAAGLARSVRRAPATPW